MREYFPTTARLGFSVWSEADLPDALELWGDPNVTRFIVADGEMSQDQVLDRLKKEIETYYNAGIQYWPVYLIEAKTNIGCCGLRPYDSRNNTNGNSFKGALLGEGLRTGSMLGSYGICFSCPWS